MGIFSKFQIKDIKTKILGGKVKHKPEVPAIAVSPPTPLVQNNFSFPEAEESPGNIVSGTLLERENVISATGPGLKRSRSLPEVFGNDIADPQIIISYLKLPKSSRKKRRRRSKRAISCPDNLSEFHLINQDIATGADRKYSSDADGPNDNVSGYYTVNESGDLSNTKIPHLKTENPEFNLEDVGQERKLKTYVAENRSHEHYSIERSYSLDSQENVNQSMDPSPCAEELSNSRGTTILYRACDQQSEISKASGHTILEKKIQRRVATTFHKTPETRWSLDLEKLRADCNSDNSLESSDSDMKWDGQSPNVSSTSKNLVSTWSLDLEKALEKDNNFGRAYSEINVSGSPNLRDASKSLLCEQVMFNAKSLDLEFVKQTPNVGDDSGSCDRNLNQPVLKRGISEYVGKINGIVSKFSTWSLDIEVTRKRSMEGELDDKNRAQSEMTLDEHEKETGKKGRSVSYHSLLYDVEEASRYQIYQPTVYEIGDDTPGQNPERALIQPRQAGYGNSMKYISKQFESLYENGKNIYKHKQKMITDAIKQREKELKAIADREAKAKQGQTSEKSQTELFFKPKAPPRRRSTSHKKHVKQPTILQNKVQE